jgi:hypothetical protein
MSDDPLDKEISFKGGVRGKFYQPGMVIHMPVYLEESVLNALSDIAHRKEVEVDALVNEVLKRDLANAETLR